MFINDVGTMKHLNYATKQKSYAAVVLVHGMTLAGQHPQQERELHKNFNTATRARVYGERVLARLQRWVKYAEDHQISIVDERSV
jgi:hypothetical protein